MSPLLRHGAAQGAQLVALQRRLELVEATLPGRSGRRQQRVSHRGGSGGRLAGAAGG